ncbi:MAG: helix-turn-helix domain-containing protein [Aquabacterium sp.]|uniref:helix-turn-helix domain-containing protein n=1 Tax=Aquabacterium sp. TaxID=1872578 RepID=UPI003BCDEF30
MSELTPNMLSTPDAVQRGAGDILRQAREAHGMTIEALSATIKVPPAKLDALEKGRYDLLQDPNYVRALAMTVCRALRIDAKAVLSQLPAARQVPLVSDKEPLNQPFKESRVGTTMFDHGRLSFAALMHPKWLAPIALLLAALVIYFLPDSIELPRWMDRTTSVAEPADAAPSVAEIASAAEAASQVASAASQLIPSVPSGVASAAQPASVASQADLAVPVSVPVSASAASTPRVTLMLDPVAAAGATPVASSATPAAGGARASAQLLTRQTAWIEVKDAQGAKLLSRQVQAGESLSVDGVAPLVVRVGNAPAVQLTFKGQVVDLVPYTRNNVARIELK